MSAFQSFLTSPPYGYDVVVATTQRSINATMKKFLSKFSDSKTPGGEPETVICYVADKHGLATRIDFAAFMALSNGVDPFEVPDGADSTNLSLADLQKARFMFAIKARIGLPPGYAPNKVPDLVVLGTDAKNVTFNLTCSHFQLTQFTPGSVYSDPSFMNRTQPSGDAWMFTSHVDMRYLPYDPKKYGALPDDVQASVRGSLDTEFSIQSLLLDLDTASLESIPQISGVDPGTDLYAALEKDFIGAYFTEMKKKGYPLLGAVVRHYDMPPSSLPISSLEFEVAPLVGPNGQPLPNPTPEQTSATTLNYLCMTAGHKLPPANAFDWNWLEVADESAFHGAISINRDRFADYLTTNVQNVVSRCCYAPSVRLDTDSVGRVTIHLQLTPDGPAPAAIRPASGATLLQYRYSASSKDVAGAGGGLMQLQVSPSYSMDVAVAGDTITFTQHLVVYCVVRSLATQIESNVVDRTFVDTYRLSIDGKGELAAMMTSTHQNDDKRLYVNDFINFWTNINQLEDAIANAIQAWTSPAMIDIPLSMMRGFIFPGGNTFAFKDVVFSDNQDLVAHITYLDPVAPVNIADMLMERKRALRAIAA